MGTIRNCKKAIGVGTIVLLLSMLAFVPTFAQVKSSVVEKLAEALDAYSDLEFEKGISIAKELLQRGDLTDKDSIVIYEALSIITYAKGEQYRRQAFDYLGRISGIGPCLITLPRDIWPAELRDHWYKITKAKNLLMCPGDEEKEIKTIAIMQFDNFSVGKYQEQLGFLSKGLADFFEHDFSKISSLKVVERDKIDFILKELKLQESGKVDGATAARIGKILGAQLMVFGSITQLDSRQARMIVRVVKVETSEIIASVEKQGKPDYVTMEKELVEEIAGQLDIILPEKTKNLLKESGTGSMDAATLYSKGLDYMDKYDYKKAYEFFKLAYEKDNDFDEAKRKMDIYRPLVG